MNLRALALAGLAALPFGVAAAASPPPTPAPINFKVRFPEVEGRNLERRRFDLPGDFEGERNLCLIPFHMNQQADVTSWFEQKELVERPGLRAYELPTGERFGRVLERLVDEGMRLGVRDDKARARTIVLWTDKESFKRALRIPVEDRIQVLLVDRKGRVLWRTTGPYTEAKGRELLAALGGRFY